MLKPEDQACYEKTNQVSEKTLSSSSESRNLHQPIMIKLATPWTRSNLLNYNTQHKISFIFTGITVHGV